MAGRRGGAWAGLCAAVSVALVLAGVGPAAAAPGSAPASEAASVRSEPAASGRAVSVGATGSPFADVATDSPFLDAISWLAAQGITTGYADGTFRPSGSVTRQAMAAYLYRLAGSPDWTTPVVSPFTDVATDSSFYVEITWLAGQGITGGYADGGFHPTADVSRQAMSAFLFRYAHPGEDSTACGMGIEAGFHDVDPSLVFCEAIRWMASVGPEAITTGYADGTFRPTASVTRQAMAAYLYRYDQDFPAPVDEVAYTVADDVAVPAAGTVVSATADSGPVPVDQDGAPTGDAASWSGQVVLSAGADAPAVGEDFVIPPDTDTAYPLGVWGTVSQAAVNEDGTTTLNLTPAALDQVYDRFTVNYAGTVDTTPLQAVASTTPAGKELDAPVLLGPSGSTASAPGSAATVSTAASTPGLTCSDDSGNVVSDGVELQVKLRPENTRTNYRVDVGPWTSDPFVLMQVGSEIVVSVSGKLSTSATCKLTNLPKLTTIVGGGATLTLGPYVEFKLEANATFSMSQRIYVTTGFWARNGQTHQIDGRSADPMNLSVSGGAEMTLGAGLKVTFGVGLGASVGVYGTIGPELSASVTASVNTTDQVCTDLELYAEVQVNLVVDLGIYLQTWVKTWEQSLIKLEVPLWEPDPWCLTLGDPNAGPGATLTVGPLQLSYDPTRWSDAMYGASGPGEDSIADDLTNDATCTNCAAQPPPMVHAFVQVWSMDYCANLGDCVGADMPDVGPAPTITVGGRSPSWSARVAEAGYQGTAFAWCFDAERICVVYRRATDAPQLEPSQAFFDLMDTGVWVS